MFNSKSTVAGLQKKTTEVLGVFTKTLNSLKELNAQALSESSDRREKAATLLTEATELDALVSDNRKVIDKINNILS